MHITHSPTSARRWLLAPVIVLAVQLAPTPASAQTQPVPPNVAIATNSQDGSSVSRTSFVVHQVHLSERGATVVTDPDIGRGRRHDLPAQGRRAVTGSSAHKDGSTATAQSGVDPAALQAHAEAAVAQALANVGTDATSGLVLPNLALAYNACDDCRSLAAAVEVVLVSGLSADLVATNISVAVNDECTRCVAGAYAYQLIIVTDDPVELDRPTLAALAQARQRVHHISHSRHGMERVMADLASTTAKLQGRVVKAVQ